MRLFKLLLLTLLPIYLSAGFFDWFYTSPNQVTQFECPHECGKWGTESMRKVEWEAVLAIWELDHLGHALKGEEFSYMQLPKDMNDQWYRDFYSNGVTLSIDFIAREAYKSYWSREYVDFKDIINTFSACESISVYHYKDDLGELKGRAFSLSAYCMENGKYSDCCEDYEHEDVGRTFRSYKEISDFCSWIRYAIFSLMPELGDNLFETQIYPAQRVVENDDSSIKETERDIKILSDKINKYPQSEVVVKDRERYKSYLEYVRKKQEEANEIVRVLEENKDRFHSIFDNKAPSVFSRLNRIKEAYCGICDFCIAHHNAPAAYYNRALYHFDEGLNMNCIADIKKLFEMTPPEMLSEEMRAKLELRKGTAECELDLFEDAIHTLSKYIGAYPRHKEAYLERAITYLEKGNVSEALQDFIDSRYEMRPIELSNIESFEYATGLMKGIVKGAGETLGDASLFLISSVSGISHGIIALAISPQEISQEFVSACQEIMTVIKENGIVNTLMPDYPEIHKLFSGEPLSFFREGELVGQMIGHFGIDYMLLKGGKKAVQAVRRLHKANAILTLESMSRSIQVEQQMINHTREWWNRSAPIIEEIRAAKGNQLGAHLSRAFRNQSLSESQIRKILHHAEFKTFPRPTGIPQNWTVKMSKTGGGMRYRLEAIDKSGKMCAKVEVRVMPGNPLSSYPTQQKPYVKYSVNGKFLDKNGNLFSKEAPECHIPLHEYNFETFSKFTVD